MSMKELLWHYGDTEVVTQPEQVLGVQPPCISVAKSVAEWQCVESLYRTYLIVDNF